MLKVYAYWIQSPPTHHIVLAPTRERADQIFETNCEEELTYNHQMITCQELGNEEGGHTLTEG